MTTPQRIVVSIVAAILTAVAGFHSALGEQSPDHTKPYQLPQLEGLEDPNTFVPAENLLTAKKVDLGRLLFFDKRLSKNNTIACASCHLSGKGFTDGKAVSTGIHNLKGGRSAPASINRVFGKAQFWDG